MSTKDQISVKKFDVNAIDEKECRPFNVVLRQREKKG